MKGLGHSEHGGSSDETGCSSLAPTAVTAAAVNKAANAADTAAADIRKQVNTTVGNMFAQASSFTGAAGTTFRRVLGDFSEDMDKFVLQKLEELSAGTRTAATKLFGTDEAGATAIANAGASPSGGGGVTSGLT